MSYQKIQSPPALFAATAVVLISTLAAMLWTNPHKASAAYPSLFVNVAHERGLPIMKTGRTLWVDLDGDGYPEAVLANKAIYRSVESEGQRRFEKLESEALAKPCGSDGRPANLLLFADVNNDGHQDAYAVRFQEPEGQGKTALISTNTILLGDGQGQFKRLKDSGVGRFHEPIIAATFVDADRDGWLDIYTGASYRVYGRSYEASENRLLRNTGGGRMVDHTQAAGLTLKATPGLLDSRRPTYGVAHCDWNNDGAQDLIACSYGRQWNRLWANDGQGRFKDQSVFSKIDGDDDRSGQYPKKTKDMWLKRFGRPRLDEKPFRSNGNTFDAACADFDNDGDIDVFLSEITHEWAGSSSDKSCLLVNLGKDKGFQFERRPKAIPRRLRKPGSRWNQGDLHAAWLDYDNDGLLDLLIAAGEYPDGQFLELYRQREDHSFEDVSYKAGLYWEGSSQPSLADFDGDGDIDILIGNSFHRLPKSVRTGRKQQVALFENRTKNGNHWLNVRLVGAGAPKSNKDAIGARVTVFVGERRMLREVYSSLGHAGHSNFRECHFGLGAAEQVDRLEVSWPGQSSKPQVFENIDSDQFLVIEEGNATLRRSKHRLARITEEGR